MYWPALPSNSGYQSTRITPCGCPSARIMSFSPSGHGVAGRPHPPRLVERLLQRGAGAGQHKVEEYVQQVVAADLEGDQLHVVVRVVIAPALLHLIDR